MSHPEREHPVVVCAHGADSAGAVQLGAQLAAVLRQPVLLVSAYRYEAVGLGASPLPSSINAAHADAAAFALERAQRLVPRGLPVDERVVPAERVPKGLVDVAREVDGCLLVLGRDVDGHVTRAVLEDTSCPVAIAPIGAAVPEPEPVRRIGVAYDGSAAARCALTAAVELARDAGAEATVAALVAGEDLDGLGADVAELTDGTTVELRRLVGEPGRALVTVSEGFDLLLCGSRGRGRLAAAVLGSVSSHLVRAARCPVVVVPPGTRARPGTPLGVTTASA